jgi:hypothetical protein
LPHCFGSGDGCLQGHELTGCKLALAFGKIYDKLSAFQFEQTLDKEVKEFNT